MKILYFHQYFCTPQGSGGIRSYAFARRWVAAGHDVTVISSSGFDDSLVPGRAYDVEGIKVRVIGGVYKPTMGFAQRLYSYLAYALHSAWIALCARKYDVVLATSTPLTIAIPALIAKIFAKCPVVFEVRDVWPDAAVDAGVLKKGFLYHCARWLEMTVYRKSDHIVALSDGMLDRIVSKGVKKNKVTMFPNCSDTALFKPQQFDRPALRNQFGVKEETVLLYVGAINTANDMPFLSKCLTALKDDSSVKWWFVGGGNQLKFLEEEVRTHKIENVTFWGKRPKADIPKFVNAADVGIVSFINQPVYYENSPNKFFDYIAGGLPPVFTRTTWLKPYLEKVNADLICEQNTVGEFVSIINKLKPDAAYRSEVGACVLELANHEFSRDRISAQYIDLLEKTASGR
ncbi:glycosyltransferase family 4 protein [Pontiellaceae bacterium B12219]|nr:glycosyltransferase family 4 protein [Pontiellaceae bacterium B12219]